ncbi:hypothetical protein GTO10_01785 [Candidatus Saccharibacteria bacterium]|nr:hypothetical protein [Candidatus Saccharibacteria bacterium]
MEKEEESIGWLDVLVVCRFLGLRCEIWSNYAAIEGEVMTIEEASWWLVPRILAKFGGAQPRRKRRPK